MSRLPLAARGRPPVERTLRVRRRMLQTPVVRFVHRGTGRTVTIVGVVHMAQASYYRRLHAVLAKHEAAGALIFYELISRAAGTEWSAASHAERDAWNTTATGNREWSQAVCRYLGWASQAMVDERNHRVLASLPSDRDSVVFWGSGHLPGLAAGLQQAGYQRQASAWLNAGELPPLRSSAKAVWAVLREDRQDSEGAA